MFDDLLIFEEQVFDSIQIIYTSNVLYKLSINRCVSKNRSYKTRSCM